MILSKFWNLKVSSLLSALLLLTQTVINKLFDLFSKILFLSNIGSHGKNSRILRGVVYRYPKVISIGDNVVIGEKCTMTSEVTQGHYLIIDTGVSIGMRCCIDFTGGVKINKDAHIAHEVMILTHDHGYCHNSPPVGKSLVIGENAFIGSRVVVLSNCNYIGRNSVVGMGSVVTKDIPDNTVVAGNPAKVLKDLSYGK